MNRFRTVCHTARLVPLLLFAVCCGSCGSGSTAQPPLGRWLYQLQGAEPDLIQGWSGAVIDYSSDGSETGEYTQLEVSGISARGTTPVAYLSIGEAENYRFYWNAGWVTTVNGNDFTGSAPPWLGHTNPDWAGNYKVRYWDTSWRDNYLAPYLDRIIGQGFQGVYLDIIDAYVYWADPGSYGTGAETVTAGDPVNDEQEAALRMIDLVVWIADYCRDNSALGDQFLVIPQNGEGIVDYDSAHSYMNKISGLGVEDLWYNGAGAQSAEETDYRLSLIASFTTAGKPVLSVDYVDDGTGYDAGANIDRIKNYIRACEGAGFFCYAARGDRALDRINTIPGVQP